MFLSQLKVSLLLTSLDSPLTFKELITKLSTLEMFDEYQFIDIIQKAGDGPGVRPRNIKQKHNKQNKNREQKKENHKQNIKII